MQTLPSEYSWSHRKGGQGCRTQSDRYPEEKPGDHETPLWQTAPPEGGLPGGVPRGITSEERRWIKETADLSVEFALFALQLFKDLVLRNKKYLDLVLNDAYKLKTYYMGMVDENRR